MKIWRKILSDNQRKDGGRASAGKSKKNSVGVREGGEGENQPVTKKFVESDDELLFVMRDVSSLDIWSQIVQPSQSTTLATSL